MNDNQRSVLKIFKTFKKMRPHVAALRMGHKESAPISGRIKYLEKQGILKKEGKGKETVYIYNLED